MGWRRLGFAVAGTAIAATVVTIAVFCVWDRTPDGHSAIAKGEPQIDSPSEGNKTPPAVPARRPAPTGTASGSVPANVGLTASTSLPASAGDLDVLFETTDGQVPAKCNGDGAIEVKGGPHEGVYPLRQLKEIALERRKNDATKLAAVTLTWADGTTLRIPKQQPGTVINIPPVTGLGASAAMSAEFLNAITRIRVGVTGERTWKPQAARGDIPPPPPPANDKQMFVLYDAKYLKDAKLKGHGIVARIWARKPELFKKPGICATFLTFYDPVKDEGELAGMTHVERSFNLTLLGGGRTSVSWRTRNPSGRAKSIKGAAAWDKQFGVVAVGFSDSFVKGKSLGFMLRDEDCEPTSNILLFDAKAFKDGDVNKEFAEVRAQVQAGGT